MRVSVCIGVYQCVTISLIHITLADQGEIHVSRCITRVLRAYRRVSTRLRCNTRRIADTSLNDVIQLQILEIHPDTASNTCIEGKRAQF